MIDLRDVYCELWRQGDMSFVWRDLDGRENVKQRDALVVLRDTDTRELLFGGAGGGSKTWTGCTWQTFMCLQYPQLRYFVGRAVRATLYDTTVPTFYKVFDHYGLKPERDYIISEGHNQIVFPKTDSVIKLLSLEYEPKDPFYNRYGSSEYTGGWIEEGGEVRVEAYNVLKTRIGRQNNDKYGVPRKLLITANPQKNWLYSKFYKPSVSGTLPADLRFISSLAKDNPFVDRCYHDTLNEITDPILRQRLRDGVWDYDDNSMMLINRAALDNLFTNAVASTGGGRYITADIARYGSDKAVVMTWNGYEVVEIIVLPMSSTTDVQAHIVAASKRWNVPAHNIIADEDGVGGGVVDSLHIRGFQNNAQASKPKTYTNMQAECLYMLAEAVNDGRIGITAELSDKQREDIIQDLEQVQSAQGDKEGQMKCKNKEQIKRDIGRSPDYRDAMLMRMYFDIPKNNGRATFCPINFDRQTKV